MTRIEIKNATKSYGNALALNNVSFALQGGRVHALMGENGAGKSTLIKLIAGLVQPDNFQIMVDGETCSLGNASDAKRLGFHFIHQELDIVPQISVAENIYLAQQYPRLLGVLINWSVMKQRARAALSELDVDHIDVSQLAARLPTGDQMLMRISSALLGINDRDSNRLFVFDEPTAALSEAEAKKLFAVIKKLKDQGAAILYVSHRLNEVMNLCDDVTVLRDGAHVLTTEMKNISRQGIIQAMTGREMTTAHPIRYAAPKGETICRVTDLTCSRLKGLEFTLHKGEILGIGGLENSGQTELLQILFGLRPKRHGLVEFDGKQGPESATEAWQSGMAYVPRERRSEALMLKQSVLRNILQSRISENANAVGLMKQKTEISEGHRLANEVGLRFRSLNQPVYQLSGGNQQKVVFARALSAQPKLMLLDEPTRGVDVGSKFEIYTLLRQMSASGCGIIMSSSDLPELIGLCDRILILQDGRQHEIIPTEPLSSSELLSRYYPAHLSEARAS